MFLGFWGVISLRLESLEHCHEMIEIVKEVYTQYFIFRFFFYLLSALSIIVSVYGWLKLVDWLFQRTWRR